MNQEPSRERWEECLSLGFPARVVSAVRGTDWDGNRPAVKAVLAARPESDPVLVLFGPSRSGKSCAAALAAASRAEPGKSVTVLMPCEPSEQGAWRSTANGCWCRNQVVSLSYRWRSVAWLSAASLVGKAFDSQLWDKMRRVDVLVIDDLGAELAKDGSAFGLMTLIAERYDQGLETIVTTNLDVSGLTSRYGRDGGERLIARLSESPSAWIAVTKEG